MADTKAKKRKWVKDADKAAEKPAFKPRDEGSRISRLYPSMTKKG